MKRPKQELEVGPIGAGFLFCLLLLVLWVAYKVNEGHDLPENVAARAREARESKKPEAWTYCQQQVKDSLKSPSTADFPWRIEVHANEQDVFTVDSYVDAQNGFGAQIRARYFCQLKRQSNGEPEWKVLSFKLRQ